MSNLHVAPGSGIPHNPEIHGLYVILAATPDPQSTTPRQGIVIPYSLIQDSSASVSTLEVPLQDLQHYFSSITIPEVYRDVDLTDPVLVSLTIGSINSLQSLIINTESEFYIPYTTVSGLEAWRSLSLRTPSSQIINPLVALLTLHNIEITQHLIPIDLSSKDSLSVRTTQDISTFNAIIQHTDFVFPVSKPPEQENLNNVYQCFEILDETNDGSVAELAIKILNDPSYWYLIHEPELLKYWPQALVMPCNQETVETITRNTEIDGTEPYLFSVEELTINGALNEVVRPLDEGLKALDYYAGFPIHELNLSKSHITGAVIPACFCNYLDYTAERIIDFLYPEIQTSFGAFDAEGHKINSVVETSPGIYNIVSGVGYSERLYINNGPILEIYVIDAEEFEDIVNENLGIIQQYYPTAQANPGEYITSSIEITGIHRNISFYNVKSIGRIFSYSISMVRGWISITNGKLDCTLSSTCLYSFLNRISYNYFPFHINNIFFNLNRWNDRGFALQRWLYKTLKHLGNGNIIPKSGVINSFNIFYKQGRKDLLIQLFPERYLLN